MSEVEKFFVPCERSSYVPKNGRRLQWIKTPIDELDDPNYRKLTPVARGILEGLRRLYARTQNPIPWDTRFISESLSVDTRSIPRTLTALLSLNFIELHDSKIIENARYKNKNKKEDSVSNDTAVADAPAPSQIDGAPEPHPPDRQPAPLSAMIWGAGLDWLADQTGKPSAKLRSLVGKWRKEHGDSAVLWAMAEAQKTAVSEPIEWITAALKARDSPKSKIREPDPPMAYV